MTVRPISVGYRMISEHAASSSVEQAESVLRRQLGFRAGVRLGLGVDRLDYTKGLLKRLWALDEFFTQFSQHRGKFTFLQIAIPTRTKIGAYQLYGDLIRETVADINQRHIALFKDIVNGGNE